MNLCRCKSSSKPKIYFSSLAEVLKKYKNKFFKLYLQDMNYQNIDRVKLPVISKFWFFGFVLNCKPKFFANFQTHKNHNIT